MLKRASMRRAAKPLMALTILAAAALYLVGNGSVSLWDRDEPRYAQCSRQMLYGFPGGKGPDLIVPRFLDKPRTEKPPLIYWCQAAAMKVFGDNGFAARFPSSVAMVIVLTLLAVLLSRAVGPRRSAWAVFIMATSALTIMSAKMCLTDAMLLVWLTIAQACTFAVYRGNRSWWVTLALWVALGLGGITKGPIVLAVLAMTLLALAFLDWQRDRRLSIRWWLALRPLVGILIVAAFAAPWLYLVEHREPGFIDAILHAAKRHSAQLNEKHVAPPGYYLAMIWGLLFPWSLLLPTTLTIAWRHRHLPVIRYGLAMILGIWVLQEALPTKLPFYMLPTFPAIALLMADALVRCLRRECDDLLRPAFMIAVAIWSLAVLALGGAPWALALPKLDLKALLPWGGMVALSVAAVAYAGVVFWLFARRQHARAALAMGIGVMVIFALLFTVYLPKAEFLKTSERLVAVIRQRDPANAGNVYMIEYKEPSLAFYRNGTVLEQRSDDYLEITPTEKWPAWVVMPAAIWHGLPAATRANLEEVGPVVHGLDYAGKVRGSQVVDVVVLRRRDGNGMAVR